MMEANQTSFLVPEWSLQDAVMLAWPHSQTDWNYMLEEVTECYKNIAKAILLTEDIVVVTPDVEKAKHDLKSIGEVTHRINYYDIETNDTWIRDFGPITIARCGKLIPIDFKFDAWGMKFAADKDNLVTSNLKQIFANEPVNCRGFVLEGGSIETDGDGVLMTTSSCLLSPNRNAQLNKDEIEVYLKKVFNVSKILWLNHGEMSGDDTDGHIDTLARFTPFGAILYNGIKYNSANMSVELKASLELMEAELRSFTNRDGQAYKLIQLPVPDPIYDENGLQLPATYANYLVINEQVLVPIYNQPRFDSLALEIISQAFPEHTVTGIDCNALIKQHGSLHCVTMQIPSNTLKI